MLIRAAVFVCAAIALSAEAAHAQQSARRTWVIPHVLERPSRAAMELHMVNLDRRATVEVNVFANDGQPMKSRSGQAVCNPCRVTFTASPKQVFSLRDRIEAAGGYAGEPMSGYIVFTATSPASVNLQNFVVNSHGVAASLSVFGHVPEEVRSTLDP